MQQIEVMFSGSSGNLGEQITNFFNRIDTLSTDPARMPLRQGVLTAAGNLANPRRMSGSQLASVPQGFTSKFTALSAITFSPAAGVCATMMLVGDAEGGGLGTAPRGGVAAPLWSAAWVETLTVPSRNPASCRARATLPSGWPTKFGITNACRAAAVVTSRLIFGAETPLAFAGGLCEIT